MDAKRANEIVAANGVIDVLYQDRSVWIESVNENNTANVHYIEDNRKDVIPLYMLVENEKGFH